MFKTSLVYNGHFVMAVVERFNYLKEHADLLTLTILLLSLTIMFFISFLTVSRQHSQSHSFWRKIIMK